MSTWRGHHQFLGEYLLRPHPANESPAAATTIGYVDFGDENHITQSIFSKGAWGDRKGKPWPQPVVRWYSMEKPDGSPLF